MSELVQVLGLILIVAGVWLWLGPAAGLIGSGACLLIAGEALDREVPVR